jgi:hypothetical protein
MDGYSLTGTSFLTVQLRYLLGITFSLVQGTLRCMINPQEDQKQQIITKYNVETLRPQVYSLFN